MPWDKKKYPPAWDEIRLRILERDRHQCWDCHARNYSVGVRLNGVFILHAEATDRIEGQKIATGFLGQYGRKLTVIELQISHSCHDSSCADESHLFSRCQYHHNLFDREHRKGNAQRTRLANQQARQRKHWNDGTFLD